MLFHSKDRKVLHCIAAVGQTRCCDHVGPFGLTLLSIFVPDVKAKKRDDRDQRSKTMILNGDPHLICTSAAKTIWPSTIRAAK